MNLTTFHRFQSIKIKIEQNGNKKWIIDFLVFNSVFRSNGRFRKNDIKVYIGLFRPLFVTYGNMSFSLYSTFFPLLQIYFLE